MPHDDGPVSHHFASVSIQTESLGIDSSTQTSGSVGQAESALEIPTPVDAGSSNLADERPVFRMRLD